MINIDKDEDLVALIAPSSAYKKNGVKNLELSFQELEYTKNLYSNEGYKCIYEDNLFEVTPLEYLAASKESRINQFKKALDNPKVKIISAVSGGYGCSEIIFDFINHQPISPKILIGFSDITAMHLLFNQRYNMPSIHGIINKKFEPVSKNIFNLLNGHDDKHDLQPINAVAKDSGSLIKGIVAGGNLCILSHMCGTALSPDFTDKIVIFEDIDEPGYRIHRSLLQLHNANLLQKAKAVIFADFSNSDSMKEASIQNFIAEYLADIPVYRNNRIGHTEGYPFILGVEGQIKDNYLVINNPFKSS